MRRVKTKKKSRQLIQHQRRLRIPHGPAASVHVFVSLTQVWRSFNYRFAAATEHHACSTSSPAFTARSVIHPQTSPSPPLPPSCFFNPYRFPIVFLPDDMTQNKRKKEKGRNSRGGCQSARRDCRAIAWDTNINTSWRRRWRRQHMRLQPNLHCERWDVDAGKTF